MGFTEIVNKDSDNAISTTMTEMAVSRVAQEVQAAMAVAKRFPRDENAAYNRLMKSCKRKGLAECAIYSFPRGGAKVEGPSIRLAEAAAQSWGNIDFGVVELEHSNGESTVMSYAWDLETNTRQTKIFTVRHERSTRQGTVRLSDPRDIYEMCANQGARRLRACILGVIPGDVMDDAVAVCEATLRGNTSEPITDRARKIIVAFGEKGVTKKMVEERLGHSLDAITEHELADLRKVFMSLKDGMSKPADWFKGPSTADALKEKLETDADDAASEPRDWIADIAKITTTGGIHAMFEEAAKAQSDGDITEEQLGAITKQLNARDAELEQ